MNKTRKIAIILVALIFAIGISFLSTTVYADGGENTIQNQIDTADGSITITISENNTESLTISDGKDVTLIVNATLTNEEGKDTITVEKGGNLTIMGSGTVDNVTHAKAALYNNGDTTISGNVTLTRSKENGNYEPESNGENSYYTILNHGVLTIEDNAYIHNSGGFSSLIDNGYYSSTGTDERQAYIDGTGQDSPVLYVNGGTLEGGINTVKNDENGRLYVNGGTLINYVQFCIWNESDVVITGGTLVTYKKEYAVIDNRSDDNNYASTCIISGGSFTGDYMLTTHLDDKKIYHPTFEITGGVFNYSIAFLTDHTVDDSTEDITISGGTYSDVDVIPEYDEDTYMLLDNEDGTYTVVLKSSYDESVYNITTNENGSVTVTEKDANYTAVEEALAEAKELDESDYTVESWSDLQQAISNVVYDLKISDQDTVNSYAKCIQDAINNLVKVDDEDQTEDPQDEGEEQIEDTQNEEEDSLNPTTGDMIILFGSILLVSVAGLIVTIKIRKRANK